MGKGVIIAAIAVVAVVAVGAVVFLLPNEKSAYDLLPDVGSFPDYWTCTDKEAIDSSGLDNIKSMAAGAYIGPGSVKMTVFIQVFDSADTAKDELSGLRAFSSTWSPTDSKYFANGFEFTNAVGTFHFFQYKNVVGWLELENGSLSSDPANDEWGRIMSDIGDKINSSKKLFGIL